MSIKFRILALVFTALSCLGSMEQLRAQLVLTVVDSTTQQPLSYALVYNLDRNYSAETDPGGSLILNKRIMNELPFVTVSRVGYREKTVQLQAEKSELIILLATVSGLPSVEVVAKQTGPELGSSSNILYTPQLAAVPALLGEFDPIKALTLLPGVSTGAEGTAGIIIRGGNPNQTSLLIDGVPVYNVNHLGGFLSAIPGYGTGAIKIYKGGVPARYSGRLSGVIDVAVDEGRNDRHTKQIGIGTALARLGAEGPLGENGSYFIGGRLGYPTYLNEWASASRYERNEFGSITALRMYDTLGKLTYRLGDWKLSGTVFLSGDSGFDQFGSAFNFNYEEFEWGNIMGSFRAQRQLKPNWRVGINLSYGSYDYEIFNRRVVTGLGQQFIVPSQGFNNSSVNDTRLHATSEWTTSYGLQVENGVELVSRKFDQDLRLNLLGELPVNRIVQLSPTEQAVYTSLKWSNPQSSINLRGGLRLNHFRSNELSFSRWQPRLALNFRLLKPLFLNLGYDRQHQFVHEFQVNTSLLPSSIWELTDGRLPLAGAEQVYAGFAGRSFKKHPLKWSVEVFYKEFTGLSRLQPGAETDYAFGRIGRAEAIALNGTGNAEGIEIFLQQDFGKIGYTMAYTLSRSDRTYASINEGKTFPFTFDRRHDINAVLVYQASERWKLSANFIYQTGHALTLPIGQSAHFDLYDGINNARFPSFHLLNVAATKSWQSSKKSSRRHQLNLSIYNLYNRANPFTASRSFSFREIPAPDGGSPSYETTSQINTRSLLGITPGISYTRFFD